MFYLFTRLRSPVATVAAFLMSVLVFSSEVATAQSLDREEILLAIIEKNTADIQKIINNNDQLDHVFGDAEITAAVVVGVKDGDYAPLRLIIASEKAELGDGAATILAALMPDPQALDILLNHEENRESVDYLAGLMLALRVEPALTDLLTKLFFADVVIGSRSSILTKEEMKEVASWTWFGPDGPPPLVIGGPSDPTLLALQIFGKHGATFEGLLDVAFELRDPILVQELIKLGAVSPKISEIQDWIDNHRPSARSVALSELSQLITLAELQHWEKFDQLYDVSSLSATEIAGPDRAGRYLLPALISDDGFERATNLIEQHQVPVDLAGPQQKRPLIKAVEFGHVKLVDLLLSRGSDAKPRENDWPLRSAAKLYHTKIMARLMAAGADITTTDLNGNTILHHLPFPEIDEQTGKISMDVTAFVQNLAVIFGLAASSDFDFDRRNIHGESILGSSMLEIERQLIYPVRRLGRFKSQIPEAVYVANSTIDLLTDHGAVVDDETMKLAFHSGHAAEIVGLLAEAGGNIQIGNTNLLSDALEQPISSPYQYLEEANPSHRVLQPNHDHIKKIAVFVRAQTALALLDAGAPLPKEKKQIHLLNAAASMNSELFQRLIRGGYSAIGIEDMLYEIALFLGDVDMVEALFSEGIDPLSYGVRHQII